MESQRNNSTPPTFVINLNKEEDYSIPNNPGTIRVLKQTHKGLRGYNIYSHRPTLDNDGYKVSKFMFNGDEQDDLPTGLENVKSINVFVPQSDSLAFVTRVHATMNINDNVTDIALYFLKNTKGIWLIYLHMEDSQGFTGSVEVIKLFNCPDPLEISFDHDTLFRIQLENFNSQIEEAITSYENSDGNLWERIIQWLKELLSLMGWKKSFFGSIA